MAERRTTGGQLETGEDVLDLLPKQDCRSPRPKSQRPSSSAYIPVTDTERWTGSLLASMKTIGSFRRRSRPDDGASDLIKAARTTSADGNDRNTANIAAVSSAVPSATNGENAGLDETSTPYEASHAWPLFNEGTHAAPSEDPQSTQQRRSVAQADSAANGTTVTSHLSQGISQAAGQDTPGLRAAAGTRAPSCTPQSTLSGQLREAVIDGHPSKGVQQSSAAEDNKFAVLAHLLASQELAGHIAANSNGASSMPEVQASGPDALGAAVTIAGGATEPQLINGAVNGMSNGHTFYNGRGTAVPAAAPAGVTRPAAIRQGGASGPLGGGPYEYTEATRSPRQPPLQFRGGPTPEDAARAMYARAVAARERASRRHEAVRAQRQAAEEAECSFTPRTNRARNDALLKGQLSWAAPANDAPKPVTAQGKSKPPRTPRLADQRSTSSLQSFGDPFRSPSPDPSIRSPTHRAGSEVKPSDRQLRKTAGSSRKDAASGDFETPREDASIKAGERMYAEALKSLQRQRTAAQLIIQEELEQMRAAAPRARSLPHSVYGAGAETRVTLIRTRSISPRRRNPAYQELMRECTFKPKTLWRSRSAAQAPRSHSLHGRQRGTLAGRQNPQHASISTDEALNRFLRRASLTADQVPALLQLAGAGNERQPDDDSADAPEQAPAIADSLAQLALGGGAVADEADTKEAAKSGVEGGEKLSWQLQGPTGGLTPDLDFEEFLQRQKAFVEERSRKVEATRVQTARRLGKTIGISPGSRSLLRQWKSVKVERKGSLQRAGKENGGRGGPLTQTWSLDETFRPKITRRAQRKKPRSVQELHEGGRLQRERTLEQLRLGRLAAEEVQLTFAPSINPCYSINSRPLLDLANPSAYLAHEEAQRRRLEAARRAAAEERKEKELADCTFSPLTIPLPAFMQRLSSAHSSSQLSPSKSDLEAYAHQLKWL